MADKAVVEETRGRKKNKHEKILFCLFCYKFCPMEKCVKLNFDMYLSCFLYQILCHGFSAVVMQFLPVFPQLYVYRTQGGVTAKFTFPPKSRG